MTALERLGGSLLRPRATFLRVLKAREGGFTDAAWLTLALSVLVEAPTMVRAVMLAEEMGARPAVSLALGSILGGIGAPVVLTLIGAVALTLFGGSSDKGGRDLDLAALCVIPYVAIRAVGSAIELVLEVPVARPVEVLGVLVSIATLVLAIRVARQSGAPGRGTKLNFAPSADRTDMPTRGVKSSVVGLLVLVAGAAVFATLRDLPELRPLRTGDAPPRLALVDFLGRPMTLEAQRGKVVLIQFWASWCPPCRAEIPVLKRVRRLYGDGLAILGIALMEPTEDSKAYAASEEIPWPVASGDEANVGARFGVETLPRMLLLDRAGIIRRQWIGTVSETELVAAIEQARRR